MKLFFKVLASLAFLATAAQAVPVTVTVVDEKGVPVPGAVVQVSFCPPGGDDVQHVSHVADQRGQVHFTGRVPNPRWHMGSLLGGAVACKPGFVFSAFGIYGSTATLHLHRPTSQRSGVLLDKSAAPLAGATVTLIEMTQVDAEGHPRKTVDPHEYRGQPFGTMAEVKTGLDGRWSFSTIPAGYEARFLVTLPGRASETIILRSNEISRTTVLQPEARIIGRVVNPGGQPLPNVTISASPGDAGTDYGECTSDAHGNFCMNGMKAGGYALRFDRGSLPFIAPCIGNFPTERGDNVLKIRVEPGVVVHGSVRDTQGRPVQAVVSSAIWHTYTDARGNYDLRVLPGDDWIGPDVFRRGFLNEGHLDRLIHAVPGTSPRVDFVLQRAPVAVKP